MQERRRALPGSFVLADHVNKEVLRGSYQNQPGAWASVIRDRSSPRNTCMTRLDEQIMTKHDEQIQQAAHVLLERHGANAVVVAGEWVESVSRRNDRRDLDVAYRVLSAVERIVDKHTAAE